MMKTLKLVWFVFTMFVLLLLHDAVTMNSSNRLRVPSRSSGSEIDTVKFSDRSKRRVSGRLEIVDRSTSSSDRLRPRVRTRQELLESRSSLKPLPPAYPYNVDLRGDGRGIIERENKVSVVENYGPDNKVCLLDEEDMVSLCDGCTLVHEQVYNKRMYAIPYTRTGNIARRSGRCVRKTAHFGKNKVAVYVRRCPHVPDFYVSQGNGEGRVFVYIPLNSEEIKFEVHLGDFDELLDLQTDDDEYEDQTMEWRGNRGRRRIGRERLTW